MVQTKGVELKKEFAMRLTGLTMAFVLGRGTELFAGRTVELLSRAVVVAVVVVVVVFVDIAGTKVVETGTTVVRIGTTESVLTGVGAAEVNPAVAGVASSAACSL